MQLAGLIKDIETQFNQSLLHLPVRKHKIPFKDQQKFIKLLRDRMLTAEEREKLRWAIEYSRYDADSLTAYFKRERKDSISEKAS